jgi:hypothetical protein
LPNASGLDDPEATRQLCPREPVDESFDNGVQVCPSWPISHSQHGDACGALRREPQGVGEVEIERHQGASGSDGRLEDGTIAGPR